MSVEAIYEQGTLKLSETIKLPEGSKVKVIIISVESDCQQKNPLEVLQKIAELPLEGETDTLSGRDHDQVLYS